MITAIQLRAARAMLKIGTRELSHLAGINQMTVVLFENGRKAHQSTATKLMRALEKAGVIFIPETYLHGSGVALKRDMAEL
jgi:DNA-binding transcriptional regulator YiaG